MTSPTRCDFEPRFLPKKLHSYMWEQRESEQWSLGFVVLPAFYCLSAILLQCELAEKVLNAIAQASVEFVS